MQWFKHDTNSTMDFKIKKLLIRYGAVGYAIYFHCLELIAESISENNITFELEHDSEIIADDLRITGTADKSGKELVEEIMRYMIELNLFEESNGHIFCFKLLKRLDSSMTSNSRLRNLIAKAKESSTVLENHDPVMTESCCRHDGVMLEEKRLEETRREQTRLEENITSIPAKPKSDFQIVIDSYFQNYKNLYEQKAVLTEKPIVNMKQAGKMIKDLLPIFGKDKILSALDKALLDNWIVGQGYSLTTILSSNQLNKLINSKGVPARQNYNCVHEFDDKIMLEEM